MVTTDFPPTPRLSQEDKNVLIAVLGDAIERLEDFTKRSGPPKEGRRALEAEIERLTRIRDSIWNSL